MKISGITTNNIINPYSDKKKISSTKASSVHGDSVEISSVGKSLSSYDLEGINISSKEKIEMIKNSISNGTYKCDASLTAKKIMDIFKNLGV